MRARIVRGGVYERTGTMGGAVCGVLHVRDNRAESGQSFEPTPQVKNTSISGWYGVSYPNIYLFDPDYFDPFFIST